MSSASMVATVPMPKRLGIRYRAEEAVYGSFCEEGNMSASPRRSSLATQTRRRDVRV